MSYSIKRAQLLADQLERLATQHTHQLAGQAANLDFWREEAVAALHTIDDYPNRFRRLRDAQVSWVQEHRTRVPVYCPICRGACEFGPMRPESPHRIPSEDFAGARDAVRAAFRRFLLRLYHAGLLTEAEVRKAADAVDTGIEPEDLEPRP